jgi:hypothetical protein
MSSSHAHPGHESEPAGTQPASLLMLDFLAWVASRPRSYAETMDAWRTNCPRSSVWEDALADGLVCLESANGTRLGRTSVSLTPRGRALLPC